MENNKEKEGMENEGIAEIIKKLEDHERRISELERMPGKKSAGEEKKLSLKEFILANKPRNAVQKALVIGYYLEHFAGQESFNVKDLSEGFKLAKEPSPKNMNDTVNLNIKNGHMMSASEKKDNLTAWVITSTGEKFVDEGLKTGGK